MNSADNHNLTGQYNPAVHGTNGPVKVSLSGYSWPSDSLVLKTTKELSTEYPFNLDFNGGNNIGVGMYIPKAVLRYCFMC